MQVLLFLFTLKGSIRLAFAIIFLDFSKGMLFIYMSMWYLFVIFRTKAVTFFVSETFLGYKMRLIRPNTKCHTILESSGQGQAIWPHVGLTCRVILTLYPIIGLRDLDFQLRTNIQVSYHFRIVRTRPSHLTTCGVNI